MDIERATTSVQITQGWHYITFEDPTWDYDHNYPASFAYMYDQNYNYYYNGDPIYITSDTTITAVYN